jgi:hypothetical protein
MRTSVFTITALFIISIAISSCKKTTNTSSNSIVGIWVLDSFYTRDTVAGTPYYGDSIQNPSTAPTVTFSSNGIATSIDPAYIENGYLI